MGENDARLTVIKGSYRKIAIALFVGLLIVGIGLIALQQGLLPINEPEKSLVRGETRLAIPALNEDVVEIFNRYASQEDIFEVRRLHLDSLNSLQVGTPSLIFGRHDDPEELIDLAKQKGIREIGYNLEDIALSKEELLREEKKVYELAKQNNLKYIFGPLAKHVVEYGPDLARNADGIMFQLRNLQLQPNFEKQVKDLILEMKSANPEIEIRVQLDTTPNDPKTREIHQMNTQELISQIRVLEKEVTVVSLWYGRDDLSVVEEVFKELRS